jgi:hypothetical protein
MCDHQFGVGALSSLSITRTSKPRVAYNDAGSADQETGIRALNVA